MECNDIDMVFGCGSHGPQLLQVEFNALRVAAGKPLNSHPLSCFGHMALKDHTIAASSDFLLQSVELLHLSQELEPDVSAKKTKTKVNMKKTTWR